MATKACTTLAVMGLIAAVAIVTPNRAHAIEVKKDLYTQSGPAGPSAPGPARANPIPASMRQQLSDTIASESDSYVSEESEKKSSGKTYVDLEHPKFMYLPEMKNGHWTVIAKLQGAEYTPSKSGEGKGKPTGKQKTLIFNYRLDGSKWTEVEPPKWQDADTGTATAAAHK